MLVWITRSQPGARRQADIIRERGYQVLEQPVLEIEALSPAPPQGPFDLVIFLSEHAVRCGLPILRPQSAAVFAVGRRTGEVLEEAGVGVRIPDTATSEGLLEMPELQNVAGRRVLVVCGVGGRGLLVTELSRRGAAVERLVCYRRVPTGKLNADAASIGAIVAASGEGLEQIARLWFAAGGAADIALLVPSARVAERAVELGFRCIHDCRGADAAAVLRTLDALGPRG
jgi:uroporphyrinogen-III synthase